MQKIVIDTNVIVSALIQRSYPNRIINDLFPPSLEFFSNESSVSNKQTFNAKKLNFLRIILKIISWRVADARLGGENTTKGKNLL